MKTWFCSILALVGMLSTAQAEVWSLRMPGTGLLPSYAKATFLGRMHERHGGSHMGMQDYTLNIPIVDGRHSHVGKWRFNMQANVTATLMDVSGSLNLRRDEMFDIALPLTAIRPFANGDRFTFTLMPHYAGDRGKTAHAWDLGIVANYSVKFSETFTYSLGVAVSPRFAQYAAVPYISFNWQVTPDWLVRMQGFQLAALYRVNERLRVGPGFSCEGGTWMVRTDMGDRIFRVRSLMAALVAEYNFAPVGKSKRIFTMAVGTTLASTAEFCDRTARKDSISMRHYKPGVAVSLGVDFRF